MKSAKPPVGENSSHRRSQPVRQARTNPSRSTGGTSRSGPARSPTSPNDQPIDIFPAITHFADAITALPKELVRHFTLLKEVDAKLFAPEDQLFRLVDAAIKSPVPEARQNHEASSSIAPASAPMSTQNSSSGINMISGLEPVPSVANSQNELVFDPSNLPRRHLFRQTAVKIQEMLVSLEEKNHVISTANEALQSQLARIEDVWPYLENEFSDEAKWGSNNHWAYPENRISRSAHADRTRREGAAAISAAAQALADEAAARSDARKQALQAKKNSRNHNNNHNHNSGSGHANLANSTQIHETDGEDHEGRYKGEGNKRTQTKSRKTAETANVGLGISTATATNATTAAANSNPPQKRRKVEKTPNGAAPTERAMAAVFGNAAPKAKTTSPRATPAPEAPKKRKALPSGSGQAKKSRNNAAGTTTSAVSSPVLTELPEPKVAPVQQPPAPSSTPAPTRTRQNSIQTAAADSNKARPSSSASNKPNGNLTTTTEPGTQTNNEARTTQEAKSTKETSVPVKTEASKKEVVERTETAASAPPATTSKKETKTDENDRKSESVPPVPPAPQASAVTTKSGRASKPSTPALATFQEAAQPRSRASRNTDGNGTSKKNQKKGNPTIHAIVAQPPEEDTNSSMQGEEDDEEDPEVDADEPTYCYCNSVSYGEMVACDADECPREWFHLECVGLKVAPGSKAKWYCDDCKERLKIGGKKSNGR